MSWPAIDPNGPGPTTYTLKRTGGAHEDGVRRTCTATSCPDDGLANDGTVYAYSLVAANADAPPHPAPHTSKQGAAAQMEASATPDPIIRLHGEGDRRRRAGDDHVRRAGLARRVVRPSRAPPAAAVAARGRSRPAARAASPRRSTGCPTGQATTISLKDCNGSKGIAGSGSACDAAGDRERHDVRPAARARPSARPASGTTVNFTVSVNPNGAAATRARAVEQAGPDLHHRHRRVELEQLGRRWATARPTPSRSR